MKISDLSGLSLLSLSIAAVAGCGSVNTVSTRSGPAETSIPYVTQVNDALASIFLKARDVRMKTTPGGVRQAQIDVANDDFRTRRFAYQLVWLDEVGNTIESKLNNWRSAEIPSGGMTTLVATAPNAGATDFRLQVRAD